MVKRPLVFVYGTLRRRGWNHRLLAGQRCIGCGWTVDTFELRVCSGIPAIIPRIPLDGGTRIRGEVYVVDEPTLTNVRWLEAAYERMMIKVRLDNGGLKHCEAYVQSSWKHGSIVRSGDFMKANL